MGSYSQSASESSALDKRQVTSDQALGLTTDNRGNKNTTSVGNSGLNGINLSHGSKLENGNLNYATGARVGGSLSIQTLDGGAIGSAFDFANKTLSSVLSLAISRDKEAAAAAVAVNDSANAAIMGMASQAAGSNAAVTAAAAKATADNTEKYKKWALYLAIGAGAWWFWSKK